MVEKIYNSWHIYYPINEREQLKNKIQSIVHPYQLIAQRTELDVLELFHHTAVSHASLLMVDRLANQYWHVRCNHGYFSLTKRTKSFLTNPHYDFSQHVRYFHISFGNIIDELFDTLSIYDWTISIDRGSLCLELIDTILTTLKSQFPSLDLS